jgi:hypothetical protein
MRSRGCVASSPIVAADIGLELWRSGVFIRDYRIFGWVVGCESRMLSMSISAAAVSPSTTTTRQEV